MTLPSRKYFDSKAFFTAASFSCKDVKTPCFPLFQARASGSGDKFSTMHTFCGQDCEQAPGLSLSALFSKGILASMKKQAGDKWGMTPFRRPGFAHILWTTLCASSGIRAKTLFLNRNFPMRKNEAG
jgi:hypothetical protein